jgi:hypothetical protein
MEGFTSCLTKLSELIDLHGQEDIAAIRSVGRREMEELHPKGARDRTASKNGRIPEFWPKL